MRGAGHPPGDANRSEHDTERAREASTRRTRHIGPASAGGYEPGGNPRGASLRAEPSGRRDDARTARAWRRAGPLSVQIVVTAGQRDVTPG